MSSNKNTSIQLPLVVFIIFLILKLTNNIDWSWWWVTSPLWIPVALGFSLIVILFFVVLLAMIFGFSPDDLKERVEKMKNKLD